MRDRHQRLVLRKHGAFRLGQYFLERAEHQRQRRAKLMAHVGEERGLGAIDFRQRFGAAALLLVGFGVGDGGGDLARDEIHKAGIIVVEQPERIETGDEEAGPAGFAARQDRQDDRAVGALLPCPAGKAGPKRRCQLGNNARLVIVVHRRQRPHAGLVEREHRRDRGMIAIDPRRAGEDRAPAARLDQVDQRERQIARVGGERPRAALAGLLPAAGVAGRGRELAQQRQLPLADDALGIVSVGAEDAADRAVIGRNRAVGEGVIGLLGIAVALHDEELRLDIGTGISAHGLGEHGADVLPESRARRRRSACPGPRGACRR